MWISGVLGQKFLKKAHLERKKAVFEKFHIHSQIVQSRRGEFRKNAYKKFTDFAEEY